jgi:hypothetical protein
LLFSGEKVRGREIVYSRRERLIPERSSIAGAPLTRNVWFLFVGGLENPAIHRALRIGEEDEKLV